MFRQRVRNKVILAPCVKGNSYGHGLIETSKIMLSAGADWLNVNALFEAEMLRKAGVKTPIYIMGYMMKKDLADAVNLGCRLVVYNRETVFELAKAAKKLKKKAQIHIKIETGNNRQGVLPEDAIAFARYAKQFPEIEIEGMATHFANIEDTKNDAYAKYQLKNFLRTHDALNHAGIHIPLRHCGNSAATILFPETHFELVRPGIAVYGLWPSPEVQEIAARNHVYFKLQPVLSWKTRIAQIKTIPANAYVGYGCTYKTKRKTRLAILPVGYYDGYDRGFSNRSHVLIREKRAKLLGRVCMNIIMADVTNIPEARVEDPATLLGRDGREEITADFLGELIGTINYEITTRIQENIPRIVV